VHHGSLNNGHYYCYIRPGLEDKWYKFNDKTVSKVDSQVAFSTGMGGYTSKFELQEPSQQEISFGQESNGIQEPACALSDIVELRTALNT